MEEIEELYEAKEFKQLIQLWENGAVKIDSSNLFVYKIVALSYIELELYSKGLSTFKKYLRLTYNKSKVYSTGDGELYYLIRIKKNQNQEKLYKQYKEVENYLDVVGNDVAYMKMKKDLKKIIPEKLFAKIFNYSFYFYISILIIFFIIDSIFEIFKDYGSAFYAFLALGVVWILFLRISSKYIKYFLVKLLF